MGSAALDLDNEGPLQSGGAEVAPRKIRCFIQEFSFTLTPARENLAG